MRLVVSAGLRICRAGSKEGGFSLREYWDLAETPVLSAVSFPICFKARFSENILFVFFHSFRIAYPEIKTMKNQQSNCFRFTSHHLPESNKNVISPPPAAMPREIAIPNCFNLDGPVFGFGWLLIDALAFSF